MKNQENSIYSEAQEFYIIIGVIITLTVFFIYNVNKINNLVDNPRFQAIVETQVAKSQAIKFSNESKNIVNQYYGDKIGYEDANKKLTKLRENKYADKKVINDYIEKISRDNACVETYNQGYEFYEMGDYANAYLYFSQVNEKHEKYSEAKTKKEECYNIYFKPMFDSVREFVINEEYEKANNILNAQVTYVSGDKTFIELMAKCEAEMELIEFKNMITNMFNTGGYKEVIGYLTYYIDTEYRDIALDLHSKYTAEYKEIVIEEFDKLYEDKDYINALKTLSAAVMYVKDDDLMSLYSKPHLYEIIIEIKDSTFNWESLDDYEAAAFEIEIRNNFYIGIDTANIACLHVDENGKPFVYNLDWSMQINAERGDPLSSCRIYFLHHLTDSGFNKDECKGKMILKSIEFMPNKVMDIWENPEYEAWLTKNGVQLP